MNTLQERLRDEAGCHYVGREPSTVTMMMRGAADEIDRLLAVNATMREALEACHDVIRATRNWMPEGSLERAVLFEPVNMVVNILSSPADGWPKEIVTYVRRMMPMVHLIGADGTYEDLPASLRTASRDTGSARDEEGPNENWQRCFHCNAYVDECRCDGGMS